MRRSVLDGSWWYSVATSALSTQDRSPSPPPSVADDAHRNGSGRPPHEHAAALHRSRRRRATSRGRLQSSIIRTQ